MASVMLSDRQRTELESLMLHTPSAKERCRAQAVLWLAEGEAVEQVAELLHVSRQTIYNWVERFHQRCGLDLQARLRDAPRSGRPPTAQGIIDPLIEAVIDHDPRRYGYRATAWTAPLLRRYLADACGLVTSQRSVSRALDRLGLRWKRPRHELANRSPTWRQAKGGSNAA
jgi:transposase